MIKQEKTIAWRSKTANEYLMQIELQEYMRSMIQKNTPVVELPTAMKYVINPKLKPPALNPVKIKHILESTKKVKKKKIKKVKQKKKVKPIKPGYLAKKTAEDKIKINIFTKNWDKDFKYD